MADRSDTITLERGQFGDFEIVSTTGQSTLITLDWDYPGIASTFGWSPCDCGDTDGTVDCDHRTASEMIESATEYLDDHIGDSVTDPGYFENLNSDYFTEEEVNDNRRTGV